MEKDYERKHVGTASGRYVARNEVAIHSLQSTDGKAIEQLPRLCLHGLHCGKVGAIDDVGVVKVAHYAQECLVEGIGVTAADASYVERKPVGEELRITLTSIVEGAFQLREGLGLTCHR